MLVFRNAVTRVSWRILGEAYLQELLYIALVIIVEC